MKLQTGVFLLLALLPIEEDWKTAVKKSLSKKKPANGWPKEKYYCGMKSHAFFAVLLLPVCVCAAFCQKLDVKIIQRQNAETTYNYVLVGRSFSTSNGNVNCNAYGNTANCSGSSTTNGYTAPSREVSFNVVGATYSLLLPDGRVAIVNCVSKFEERMAGREGNHRSCRMPLVNDIQADFKGNNAKLSWVVSLDGKKKDSETYKILAVLPKQ